MKNKKLIIGYKQKKTKIIVEDCNLFEKFSGLMFSRKETAKILLFSFRRKQNIAIHSFFVFYPFIAIWLDDKNKVTEIKIVKPFEPCIYPRKKSFKLVEIPINKKNKKYLKFFGDSVVKKQNI
jgi:uncharacterized membrane protein (UPF0127 family)